MISSALRRHWPVVLAAAAIAFVVGLTVAPYGGNISAFFHMDKTLSSEHVMPPDFVILDLPGYDGAHYYQVSRNLPKMLSPSSWEDLRAHAPSSYAYQRFLLPAAAYVLALGQDAALPYTFLFLNIASLLGAAYILWKATGKALYVLALVLSPAAMVGIHFSLAEPITILLLTAFLTRYATRGTIGWTEILLLSLVVLAREVNIFLVGLLGLYSLYRRNWRDAFLLVIPVVSFLALHGWLYAIFHLMPFLESAGKRTFPFEAMFQLVTGGYGYNRLTITSIPLALLFVIPALVWTCIRIVRGGDRSFLVFGSAAFLFLMTTMPDHIWGSITSIGRVITPVYPLAILLAARNDSLFAKYLATVILVIGIGAGLSLALIVHPFTLSA